MCSKTLAHPSDAMAGMSHDSSTKAGVFNVIIEVEGSTCPFEVDILGCHFFAAADDAGIGGIVSDRVKDISGITGFRVDPKATC